MNKTTHIWKGEKGYRLQNTKRLRVNADLLTTEYFFSSFIELLDWMKNNESQIGTQPY